MYHDEILSDAQKDLIPLITLFGEEFGMVGGTALALQLGHRKSIDFDLFTPKPFDAGKIRETIVRFGGKIQTLIDSFEEYTVSVSGVKITFARYPFPLEFAVPWKENLFLADTETIASMKAYALGRRVKWKDYVDLYCIFQSGITLQRIVERATEMFGEEFNEKNFRVQLAYFEDIDYTETVESMPGFETKEETIRRYLTEKSVEMLLERRKKKRGIQRV